MPLGLRILAQVRKDAIPFASCFRTVPSRLRRPLHEQSSARLLPRHQPARASQCQPVRAGKIEINRGKRGRRLKFADSRVRLTSSGELISHRLGALCASKHFPGPSVVRKICSACAFQVSTSKQKYRRWYEAETSGRCQMPLQYGIRNTEYEHFAPALRTRILILEKKILRAYAGR